MGRRAETEVRIGPQGRLVLPAALRHALGLLPGHTLLVRVEGERIVLEKREQVLARVKARFASIPPRVSLVKELTAQRRAEAKREEQR